MELTIFLTCAICTILLVIVATKWVLDVWRIKNGLYRGLFDPRRDVKCN